MRILVNQGLLGRRHHKNGSDDGFIPLLPGEYNASQDLLGWIAIHRSNGENAYLNHAKFEDHIASQSIVVLAV